MVNQVLDTPTISVGQVYFSNEGILCLLYLLSTIS